MTRLPDRFWAKVQKTEGCWLWTGCIDRDGYGAFFHEGRRQFAHRLAYVDSAGPIQAGYQIDHVCHTTACVQPEHLQAVTPRQNRENLRGPGRQTLSGIRGVRWHKGKQRWVAVASSAGVRHYGGAFLSIEEAEKAAIALRLRLMTNNLVDRQTVA